RRSAIAIRVRSGMKRRGYITMARGIIHRGWEGGRVVTLRRHGMGSIPIEWLKTIRCDMWIQMVGRARVSNRGSSKSAKILRELTGRLQQAVRLSGWLMV